MKSFVLLLVSYSIALKEPAVSKFCPMVNEICIAAKEINKTACFNVHSAAKGWAAVGFGKTGMLNAEIYVGWTNSTGGYTVASMKSGNSKRAGLTLQSPELAEIIPLFDLPAPEFAKVSFAFCIPGKRISADEGYIYAMHSDAPTGNVDSTSASFAAHNGPHSSFSNDFTIPTSNIADALTTKGLKLKTVWILHGILMWVAWVVSPFVGIFVARYMKEKLGHKWYQLHLLFMGGFTILFTLAGFVLIFIYRSPPHFYNLHQQLGLVILIACVLQGLLGYISNALYDPKRKYPPEIDIAHWWVGRIVWAAGIINVHFGLKVYAASFPETMTTITTANYIIISIGLAIMAYGQFKFGHVVH